MASGTHGFLISMVLMAAGFAANEMRVSRALNNSLVFAGGALAFVIWRAGEANAKGVRLQINLFFDATHTWLEWRYYYWNWGPHFGKRTGFHRVSGQFWWITTQTW